MGHTEMFVSSKRHSKPEPNEYFEKKGGEKVLF
jgi:hypothetical protein